MLYWIQNHRERKDVIYGIARASIVTLTEEGMILRKRAEEILNLVQKTEREIALSDQTIVGDVYIGTGETDAVRFIARAARELYKTYPGIRYHIASGNSEFVLDQLEKGLIDFGIVFGSVDSAEYHFNASLMVEEGLGYAIGFDKIIHTWGSARSRVSPGRGGSKSAARTAARSRAASGD